MTRAAIVVAILSTIACSKKPASTGSPELDAYEKEHGPFTGAYVAKSGLFIDRKLVVAADKLATPGAVRGALATATLKPNLVVFDIDDEPQSLAFAMLRDFADQKITIARRADRDSLKRGCEVMPLDKADPSSFSDFGGTRERMVVLSLDVLPERTIVGLSRLEEFQEFPHAANEPDWNKIYLALREHKPNAFFSDRQDMEIAIDPALSSKVIVQAVFTACSVGFTRVSLLPRNQLDAKIVVPKPFDFDAMPTAADVRAKMRSIMGERDGLIPQLGGKSLCPYVQSMPLAETHREPFDGDQWKDRFAVVVYKNGRVRFIGMPDVYNREYPEGQLDYLTEQLRAVKADERMIGAVPLQLTAEEGVSASAYLAALGAICKAGLSDVRFVELKELTIDLKSSPRIGKPD